jgi:aspartyl-tRNA(Asn)/glutamyl-tRNA(Gln) amidotransferase subunit C
MQFFLLWFIVRCQRAQFQLNHAQSLSAKFPPSLSKMSETPHIDIDYVANLARLDLSDGEKAKLGTQLNDILGYFDKLNTVDVEGVEPMAHAHRVFNVWREGDEPGPTYAPEVLLNMAPEQRDNQVVVPKVVE